MISDWEIDNAVGRCDQKYSRMADGADLRCVICLEHSEPCLSVIDNGRCSRLIELFSKEAAESGGKE